MGCRATGSHARCVPPRSEGLAVGSARGFGLLLVVLCSASSSSVTRACSVPTYRVRRPRGRFEAGCSGVLQLSLESWWGWLRSAVGFPSLQRNGGEQGIASATCADSE